VHEIGTIVTGNTEFCLDFFLNILISILILLLSPSDEPLLKGTHFLMMRKFEKRLVILALVFVAIYIGAAAVTIHSRLSRDERPQRIESTEITPGEGQLLMAELFLPMMILFVLVLCFFIVKKQREKKMLELDKPDVEVKID